MIRVKCAASAISRRSRQVGLLALGCALAVAFTPVDTFAKAYQADWPQASSDLRPDPAVKFGTLRNGMHYAIMKNNTPTGAVSLRLRMATGSLQENDAQQGLAHMLEHLAFRGSKQVPDGEVVKTLERIGLQFGADTNAFTSHTQTVYKFDLPRSDNTSVDTGLMLLREIASELNISNAALKTERGVVLSELRLRDTPQERADDAELIAMLPGQRAALRMPIGKADIIENADAAVVRSYYAAYYQPQRATLIVTGNIDPPAIEKKIIARFGNWKAAKNLAQDPDLGTVKQPLQPATIYVEPGLPTQVSIDWSQPYDGSAATRAREVEDTVRTTGLIILNQRFQQAALSNDAPFTGAQASYFDNMMHSARVTSVGINTTPEQWQTALQAVQRTLNSALAQGVSQDEVDRVVAMMRTNLQTAVAGANTRRTPTLADRLVGSLDNHEVFLNPQQAAEVVDAALKDLRADAVTASLRKTLAGTGPLLFMANSTLITGGATTLTTAYQEALHGAAANEQAQAAVTWPYANFGTPGTVASQQKIDELDTTFVAFNNGVSLAVKPTKFSAGQLEIMVRVGEGRLALDKSRSNATFLLPSLATGGLEAIDYPSLQKALAGKTFSINAGLSDNNLILGGRTTPSDIDTQLQVIAAYLSAPALRNGAVEQTRNSILAQLPQLEAQPLSNLMARVPGMLRSNDPRWSFPTTDQVRSAKADDLKAWLQPMLQQGAVQIAIVGDITVERAIQATAATLGALPKRPAPALKLSQANEITFPSAASSPVHLQHKGGKDQAAAYIAWPAPDRRSDFNEVADLQMLGAIMQARLIDAMRSRTGSSYTANVSYDGSWALLGFGDLHAVSDIKPGQTQVFYDAVNTIVNDLRTNPVNQDEFSRAQQPALANLEKARQNNGYFTQLLIAPKLDPQSLQWLRTQPELLKAVTPERVQRVAQKYLLSDKAWKAMMQPQGTVSGD
jgi:zinc protease